MTLTELNEIKKNYKVLEIAVDFINPSYNISRAKHLDNARYIICTLTENGIPRTVKINEVARIRLQKPDHTYVYNDCDILEDGRVFITLTEQILAVEGNAICDIQLTDEKTEIIYSTKNFLINIDKTAVDNSVMESSNEFDALNKLIATNKKLNDELEANEKVRQEHEDERINNENIRQDNESDRQKSEMERNNAERIRAENETERILNENIRKTNEKIRQDQEIDRETNTAVAVSSAENATKKANDAADDLQTKLDSHHFVLTEDKDIANGVPSLDSSAKVPLRELYEATTVSKGITQLTDSVTSTSITTAATPNSVKKAYDKAVSVGESANSYTDTKIANLINGAPSTLDTLGEIADAMEKNSSVVEALNSAIGNKVDKESGKGLSTNDYTTSEKNKLSGIATGAEVNQNAFSNVLVGTTTIAADSKTDTLTLVAGSNITLTPDATGDKITISATNTSYTHPSYTSRSSGLYKITVDSTGHISAATAVTKEDITALGIPGSDTNTDTKVTQTVTTTSASYPVLLAPSGQTSTTTTTTYFGTGLTYNPSTKTLTTTTFSGALSGNASSATYTTYVRLTTLNPTSAATYYLPFTTGIAASTNYSLNGNNGIRYNTLEGTASAVGYGRLYLGNSIASGTAGNKYGALLLYSQSSGYGWLLQESTNSAVTHTLPATSGTILNTGTTSFTQTLTSGTAIGTLKINGTSTVLYAPSIANLGTVQSVVCDAKTLTVTSSTSDTRNQNLGSINLAAGTYIIFFGASISGGSGNMSVNIKFTSTSLSVAVDRNWSVTCKGIEGSQSSTSASSTGCNGKSNYLEVASATTFYLTASMIGVSGSVTVNGYIRAIRIK